MKTKRIVIEQKYERWTASAFPSRKTYVLTPASGNRLMGICNSDSDFNVYHFSDGAGIALEIHRNREAQ